MLKAESEEESWKKSQCLITFVFCTENDNSEQTLESYKSKSNEESPGHEKNEQGKKFQPIQIEFLSEHWYQPLQKQIAVHLFLYRDICKLDILNLNIVKPRLSSPEVYHLIA